METLITGGSTAAGTILNITYGYTVEDCDDPLVTLADECTSASVAAGGPGALLCDLVPARTSPNNTFGIPSQPFRAVKYWPTWAPFSGFKKHALYTRSLVDRFFDEPYQWVKARVVGSRVATGVIETDIWCTVRGDRTALHHR